ncbi:unnamed protein product [Phytophthora lilii]|uniref:Unnamed protein product n=1 Tax=Phytophthora lilii TaxID=2077276 RepID=A0A9W6TH57_9STRA|nr:unnamed protein product [Phytophthora lilii]
MVGFSSSVKANRSFHHEILTFRWWHAQGKEFDNTEGLLGGTMKRLGIMMEQGGSKHMLYLILFVVVVFVLLHSTADMGNFLATPITEKDTQSGRGNGLEFGLATMQGWRTGMEDAHVAQLEPAGLPAGCSLFAVFDGHGGRLAADLAADRLTEQLAKTMTTDVLPGGKAEGADPQKIGRAMRDAFMNLDQDIRESFEKNYGSDLSGCTAIAALITPTHIIVANSGDSRSVMAKDGRTVEMSFDHKPINVRRGGAVRLHPSANEQRRVEPRVNSGRNLGQLPSCRKVRPSSIEYHWIAHKNPDTNLRAVFVLHCSRDNMSVVIVKFPGAKLGVGGGVAKIREERARLEKAEQEANGELNDNDNDESGVAGALPAKST